MLSLAAKSRRFTSSDLAKAVQVLKTNDDQEYSARKAAYDLKKFRDKNIIPKIKNSRRYQATPYGIKTITASLLIREKIIDDRLVDMAL